MVQTPPNVYPNGSVGFPTNGTMVRPIYGDPMFNQIAFGLINATKLLEQDKIKVLPKATPTIPYPQMNQLCVWILDQVKILLILSTFFKALKLILT
jgi:hypothetical protein